mmetsp:Transcript_1566/g.1376  ORF Transcript_1566/g.1376 Transcript_1566/m.1376 type:complete len:87 (-) Transcript_1566:491-751(-)
MSGMLKRMTSTISMKADESSKTIGIGTGHYRSPELRQSGRYDEKTDIYSLGVILLEMCYFFSTGMEREEHLRELYKSGRLPKDFES